MLEPYDCEQPKLEEELEEELEEDELYSNELKELEELEDQFFT